VAARLVLREQPWADIFGFDWIIVAPVADLPILAIDFLLSVVMFYTVHKSFRKHLSELSVKFFS